MDFGFKTRVLSWQLPDISRYAGKWIERFEEWLADSKFLNADLRGY